MEFGIVGWSYGVIVPKAITFFIDGTAKVFDHHGNPIRDFKGTHAEVVQQLDDLKVEWQKLSCAGFPQLPYEELAKLESLPPTPLDELQKIKNKALRQDCMRARREAIEVLEAELADA